MPDGGQGHASPTNPARLQGMWNLALTSFTHYPADLAASTSSDPSRYLFTTINRSTRWFEAISNLWIICFTWNVLSIKVFHNPCKVQIIIVKGYKYKSKFFGFNKWYIDTGDWISGTTYFCTNCSIFIIENIKLQAKNVSGSQSRYPVLRLTIENEFVIFFRVMKMTIKN